MEVYVLVKNDLSVDSGTFDTEVIGVYENFSMAQTEMQAQMVDAKQKFQNYDFNEDAYVEGDMSWSIWELGQYASNHIDLIIQCETIQK